jgi:UDP-N-acetylmuramate dehydrogenase
MPISPETAAAPDARDWDAIIAAFSPAARACVRRDEPLSRHTTLRVGGPADVFVCASEPDVFAEVAGAAQRLRLPHVVLGEGSNVCVGDRGFRGIVLHNACCGASFGEQARVEAGFNLMRLFVKTLQLSLSGLEFAVGIPGTVGGAMVSNAGAYRANIGDLILNVDVVEGGERRTVGRDWMEFDYRDSRLRKRDAGPAALVAVTLQLQPGDRSEIRRKARDIQMQRILKQPWQASAGSFFKNVNRREIADSLPDLPGSLKDAGIVPAAYLADACGCKGLAIGGAMVARKHANFIVNCGEATASDIRALAGEVARRVWERFGVHLQEEVMYLGDWEAV